MLIIEINHPATAPLPYSSSLFLEEENCIKVPYGHLASDQFSNIAAPGVVCGLLGLDEEVVSRTLDDYFGKMAAGIGEENRGVLHKALQWTSAQGLSFPRLTPAGRSSFRMLMQGNEAIALGAISAGLAFGHDTG